MSWRHSGEHRDHARSRARQHSYDHEREGDPARSAGGEPFAAARILIVDDDADTRDLYKLLLAAGGFETRAAATLREGLRLLAEWRPDVLVCDLHFPDGNSLEVARRLRASGERTPAVAVTGISGAGELAEALEAEFTEY